MIILWKKKKLPTQQIKNINFSKINKDNSSNGSQNEYIKKYFESEQKIKLEKLMVLMYHI